MTDFAVNRSLKREDFPFSMVAVRSDNDEWCWGVTVLEPPGATLVPIKVPPLARIEGVPIYIITRTAQGVVGRTDP